MTDQLPIPNSSMRCHRTATKVSSKVLHSNDSVIELMKNQHQNYYSIMPFSNLLVNTQHNGHCRINLLKSRELNVACLKSTLHIKGESRTLSSDHLNQYTEQCKDAVKHTLVHNTALPFLLMCSPSSWFCNWLQWLRLLHKVSSTVGIVMLMLLALVHNCSGAGSDCHIPAHSPLTITFDDLTENGVMYGTCLSAPRGSQALQLMVLRLELPPLAALMVYADGESHLLHHSCSNDCKKPQGSLSDSNTKELSIQEQDLILEEVQKLEENLEKEILNTEKFIASNEKIEERYKRSDLDNVLHFGKGVKKSNSLSFEVNVDRDNIEKMTLMKEFASGKHNPKLLKSDANEAVTSCSKCPVFKQHQVIEFYLRLPKALNCSDMKSPCQGRPELEMVADLDCGEGGGVLAALPASNSKSCLILKTNSTTETASPTTNLPVKYQTRGENLANAQCLIPTCTGLLLSEGTGTKKLVSLNGRKSIKTRHKAMIRDGGFDKLGNSGISVESVRQFEIKLPASSGPSTCFWELDSTSLKYLELNIPSSIRPHITVYNENLLNPTWNAGHCPVSSTGSVWLHTQANSLYVVYVNPYPTEALTTLSILQHREGCSFPPDVPFGSHSWHPATTSTNTRVTAGPPHIVYSCDPGYLLQGSVELVCTDGTWPEPPQCVPQFSSAASKSEAMSDAPDGTAKSEVDAAVQLFNATADEDMDGGDVKQRLQLSDVNSTNAGVLRTISDGDVEDIDDGTLDEDDGTDLDSHAVDDDDYYDYNATEYDYLPEFNATTTVVISRTGSTSGDPTASGPDRLIPTPILNTSSTTTIINSVNGSLNNSQSTESIDQNLNSTSSLKSGLEDVRQLLKALSIDDEMLLYLILGCCAFLLLIIIVTVTSIIVYRRRYPVRLGLGRKFDTFQNPIYEKTVVRVPVRSVEEVEEEDDEDGEAVDDTTVPALPAASKAEMEDLSDSTVME